jgi:hypothetical protein
MAEPSATEDKNKATRRKLTRRTKKRSHEFQLKESPGDNSIQERKWGWSSDGLSEDLISSDEESDTDERHEAPGKADEASDMGMSAKSPEETRPEDLEKEESRDESSESSLNVLSTPSKD